MENILVIGSSGFLGSALILTLKQAGYNNVRGFDLTAHPDASVDTILGDICDSAQVSRACAGMDTVFQTATLVDWGMRSRARLYAVNVQGNRNVIEACQAQGVRRLIYTSSIDVVFDGSSIRNGDEQLPYPPHHLDDYGDTKTIAEQDVLRANHPNGLQTCALRSTGIYGPGDKYRFPGILDAVRQGNTFSLGHGNSLFNHIYITNLVHAHLRAAQALEPASALSGQAYFIIDHPPLNFYKFFAPYLQALGYPPLSRRIPLPIAYALALFMETLARLGIGSQRPLLTRYVVLSTCKDFYFTSAKAKRDFGYEPIISAEQAFQETLNGLKKSPA